MMRQFDHLALCQAADEFSVRLAPHQDDPHVTVVGVRGEVDLATASGLREALRPVLERHIGPVVLDLSEVAFLDSSGVHVLVETLERLSLANRQLAITCREGGQVRQVLGLVGLLDAVDRSPEAAAMSAPSSFVPPSRGTSLSSLRSHLAGRLDASRQITHSDRSAV